MNKPIICFDFDGVIHGYNSGWQGADVVPDPPVPGAIEWWGEALIRDYHRVTLAIRSSRSHQPGGIDAMQLWLIDQFQQAGMERKAALGLMDRIDWGVAKPPALVTVDDRVFRFDGNWWDSGLEIDNLLNFKPWNKR